MFAVTTKSSPRVRIAIIATAAAIGFTACGFTAHLPAIPQLATAYLLAALAQWAIIVGDVALTGCRGPEALFPAAWLGALVMAGIGFSTAASVIGHTGRAFWILALVATVATMLSWVGWTVNKLGSRIPTGT